MSTCKVHNCIKMMVGSVAASVAAIATAQPNEVIAMNPAAEEGPAVEVVYVDIGQGETIECMAVDPGYAFLDVDVNGDDGFLAYELSDPPEPMSIMVSANTFPEQDGLPMQVVEHTFKDDVLALHGHASVELGPFSMPPTPSPLPNDQILTVNGDAGLQVVMLENTLDPDVDVTCTIFTMEDMEEDGTGYYVDATGQAVKKKVVRRKIAKAKKKAVRKKATRKKAASKRRKALREEASY